MRITTGANAWRKVEGKMGDRHILRKPKGNVLSMDTWTCYVLVGISAQRILLLCVLHNGVRLMV